MDLIWLLILNGHINGPENLSVLNIYFIEALIMVPFSSKLKVWLPYNKRFTNTSSVRFEISLTIFLTESKRVWRDCIKCWQCKKKWTLNSTSKLQEHNGFKQSWKLYLNRCSLGWPNQSLSLVSNLIPNGSWILKIEFWIGLPNFNNKFLKIKTDLAFLTVTSSLFHSTIVYGKKKYLNRSVLQCFNFILIMGVLCTTSFRNKIIQILKKLCGS